MVLAYAVILLVIIALLLRRDLGALGQVSFRGGWKLIGVVIGLFILQATTILYVPGQSMLQMALLILSQMALVLLFLVNHHLPGAKIFALGIALNVAVMVANGGWMPVTPDTYRFVHPERTIAIGSRPPSSKNIILPRSETNLWILSDMIPLALPGRRTAISIGDVLLVVGVAQFIFQTTGKETQRTPASP